MRYQSDLGKVLDRLHLHIRVMERVRVSNHSMVRHEDGIVLWDKWLERIRKFRRPWSTVLRQRDGAQTDNDLADQRLVERKSGGSKASRSGGMRMHDPLHVRAQPVDQQVHGKLAGHVAITGEPAALQIDHDHIGRAQHAFAHARGSDHDAVIVKSCREIPVGSGDVTALVQHLPEEDHFASILAFTRHQFKALLGESGRELVYVWYRTYFVEHNPFVTGCTVSVLTSRKL